MSTTTKPTPTPTRKRSVMPYVFLAIAIVSVLASLVLWKHQHDNRRSNGTAVIATTGKVDSTLAIQQVRAPEIWHCSPGSNNQVILTWSATGATGVDVYVDGSHTPLVRNQSLQSQTSVPAPCAPATHTYEVRAHAADGRTVSKSATTKGV